MNTTYPTVRPFLHQSQAITFSEWISLLTLFLAPVIAHVVAGIPRPTYLINTPASALPKWHDYLALYSPVTIIWRYAALADRRLRVSPSPTHALDDDQRTWGPADLAAANAIFWTSSGWDGSEEMAVRSVLYCTSLPRTGHATLLSVDTLQTVIVTLQGVQAIYQFAGAFAGTVSVRMSIDTISFPIAFLGLVRLYAAAWISSDYEYIARSDVGGCVPVEMVPVGGDGDDEQGMVDNDERRLMAREEETRGAKSEVFSLARFRATSWPSRIFRVIYIVPVAMFWMLSMLFTLPGRWQVGRIFPLTNYLAAVNGSVSFLFILLVYVHYSVRVGCRSTVIPCVSKMWYKVLLCASYAVMTGIVIVSALETRRARCGVYSTFGREMDAYVCAEFDPTTQGT